MYGMCILIWHKNGIGVLWTNETNVIVTYLQVTLPYRHGQKVIGK